MNANQIQFFVEKVKQDKLIPPSVKKAIEWVEECLEDEGLESYLQEREFHIEKLLKSGEKELANKPNSKELQAGIEACKQYLELSQFRCV